MPFASTVTRLPELERAAHGGDRSLADEDLARLGGLLEPRGDVDGVAADERAALARPAGDHLACVHSDAERQLVPEDGLEPPLHRQRGVQRALGVVLERLRRSEGSHHRIPGELLDGSSGALDLRAIAS